MISHRDNSDADQGRFLCVSLPGIFAHITPGASVGLHTGVTIAKAITGALDETFDEDRLKEDYPSTGREGGSV